MLGEVEVVGPDRVHRPDEAPAGDVEERDRGAVAGEAAQDVPEAEPPGAGGVRGPAPETLVREDVREPDDEPAAGVRLEEEPPVADVREAPGEPVPPGQVERELPSGVPDEAGVQVDGGPLPPGPVGDLGVEPEPLLGLELRLEVGEEALPRPVHDPSLGRSALRRAPSTGASSPRRGAPPGSTLQHMQTASNDIKRAPRMRRAARVTVLAGGTPAAAALLLWATADRLAEVAAPGPSRAEDVLATGCGALAVGLLGALVWSVGLAALGRRGGRVGAVARAVDARVTPRVLRHVAGMLLGAVVGTAALPSAGLAEPGGSAVPALLAGAADPGLLRPPDVADAPDPLFRPARPPVRPQAAPDVLRGFGLSRPRGVVVHRGDTLWDVAARALGPDATDADVAEAWPRWYAANRDVVGDDPDLLLPGQVLVPPEVAP